MGEQWINSTYSQCLHWMGLTLRPHYLSSRCVWGCLEPRAGLNTLYKRKLYGPRHGDRTTIPVSFRPQRSEDSNKLCFENSAVTAFTQLKDYYRRRKVFLKKLCMPILVILNKELPLKDAQNNVCDYCTGSIVTFHCVASIGDEIQGFQLKREYLKDKCFH